MRLWSQAWPNGEPIPDLHAAARLDGAGALAPSANLSPPLSWSGLPAGTRSLALLCHDFDSPIAARELAPPARAPVSGEGPAAAGAADLAALLAEPPWSRDFPAAHERHDFFLWVLVDLPPQLSGLAPGQCRRGLDASGRSAPPRTGGARQGLNDYARLFAGRPGLQDCGVGYIGPLPPPRDALVHHIVFALFALSIDRLPLPEHFTGAHVREAMAGHVLASATHSGTYTLSLRLRAAGA